MLRKVQTLFLTVLLIWLSSPSHYNKASAEGWPYVRGLPKNHRIYPNRGFREALPVCNSRGGSSESVNDMNNPEHDNDFMLERPTPDEQEEYLDILSKALKEKQKKAMDVIISVRSPFFCDENACTSEVVHSDHGNGAIDVDLKCLLLSYRGGGWQQRRSSSRLSSNEKLEQGIGDYFDRFGRFISLWVVWVASIQAFGKAISHNRVVDELATKLLSEDTAKAVKNINEILNKFADHGVIDLFQLYSTKDILLSVLALSRLQRAAIESSGEREVKSDNSFIDTALLSDLAHYAAFANAAYGWKGGLALSGRLHLGDLKTLVARTGVEESDVIDANWSSRTHRPAYFVVRDNARRNIVLGIRGTLSHRDVLTDLCCTAEEFSAKNDTPSGEKKEIQAKAHQGMLEAARKVSEQALSTIATQLAAHPDFKLVIVGHSLGAGTAAVLGTLWQDTFPGLVVFAYGSPCVGPLDYSPINSDFIVSVVGKGDPFANLSLGHIADVSNAIAMLCEDRELRDKILMKVRDGDLSWCYAQMKKLRRETMTFEKFYPPGRVFFMAGSTFGDDGEVTLQEVDNDNFSDLVLHASMFDLSRHIPNRYEAALARLWRDVQNKAATEE